MTQQQVMSRWFRWAGTVAFVLIVIALVVVPSGGRLYAEPAGSVTMRIEPATRAIPVNGQATVQVVADLNGQMTNGLGADEFDLTYDANYLGVASIADAGGLGSTGRTVEGLGPIDVTGGKATGAYSYKDGDPLAAGPTGNGIALANVTIQANRAGVTTLNLQNALLVDTQANAWPDAGVGRNLNVSGGTVWGIVDGSTYCVFEYAPEPNTHFDCVDFDGDRKSDPVTWDPATKMFTWLQSGSGYTPKSVSLGPSTSIPLVADMDGDGVADPVTWDPATRIFRWFKSGSGYALSSVRLGPAVTDTTFAIPMLGDFDLDGKADPATWEPATRRWRWRRSSQNYAGKIVKLGPSSALPLIGDYDRDGRADPATWDPINRRLRFYKSRSGYTNMVTFPIGNSQSIPLAADMDGDGRSDPAVWLPDLQQFRWKRSGDGYNVTIMGGFGLSANVSPMVADLDGDGRADPTLWESDTQKLRWRRSGNGYTLATTTHGSAGSVPLD